MQRITVVSGLYENSALKVSSSLCSADERRLPGDLTMTSKKKSPQAEISTSFGIFFQAEKNIKKNHQLEFKTKHMQT